MSTKWHKFILCIGVLFVLLNAVADEAECPCKLEGALGKALNTLLEASYGISEKLAPLDGEAFHRSPQEIEALKVFHDNEEMLKEDCSELYDKVKRKYKVFFRLVIDEDSAIPPGRRNLGIVILPQALYLHQYGEEFIHKKALEDLSPQCRKNFDQSPQELVPGCSYAYYESRKKQSVEYVKNELRPLFKTKSVEELMTLFGYKNERDNYVNLTVLKALSMDNYEKYKDYLSSIKGKLSTQEKVQLISALGETGSHFYDYRLSERSAQLKFDEVTNSQIFKDFGTGLFENPLIKSAICRHYAAFQGASAEALGLEGLLVTSNTSAGIHTNTLIREKNGSSQVYMLDYYEIQSVKNEEGGQMLNQERFGNVDASTYYLIGKSDPKNGKEKSIALITGEAAKLYTEAIGNDIKVVEPFARTTSSLAGAEILIGGRPVTVFAGEDGNGQRYVGAAARLDWGNATMPGKAAMALGYRKQASANDDSIVEAYIDVQQGLKLKVLESQIGGARLTAQTDALALLIGDVQHYHENGFESPPISMGVPVVGANLGAEVKIEVPQSGFTAKLRGESHVRLGASDTSAMNLGFFHNLSTVASEISFKRNNHEAMARAVIMFDAFGPKAMGELGYGHKEFASQIEASGRLRKEDATIREGSIRRVGLKVRQGIPVNDGLGLVLHFGASAPIEEKIDGKLMRFMGGFGGKF